MYNNVVGSRSPCHGRFWRQTHLCVGTVGMKEYGIATKPERPDPGITGAPSRRARRRSPDGPVEAIRRSNSHEQERTRHGRSTLLTAPRAVRRFFVRHRLLACFSRPEKSGPRCFEQQHKSNKAMEATKSHVQARKHKCDDQLIIKCCFHKFRIEGS